jgi:hypothetical protein
VPRIAIAALVIALGVAAWYSFGSDDPPTESEELSPGPSDTTPPAPTNNAGATLKAPPPSEIPEMTLLELEDGARLLMIARIRETWTATIEQTLHRMSNLDYRIWYTVSNAGGGAGGPGAGEGRGLPELKQPPTADYLESNDIQALVFDEADPNEFPLAFWNAVAERVRSGQMGLYVRPGVPFDARGQTRAVHPMLEHPVLKDLLPVASAYEIKGNPLPGNFPEKQPLAPTDAGFKHPATRLVPVEQGSRNVWHAAGVGEGSIGSQFCYPAKDLQSGAVVLLNMQAGVDLPAVIVSGAPTRVLWMGNIDFGDRKTHFNRDKDAVQRTLLNHWWVWLLGQSPE